MKNSDNLTLVSPSLPSGGGAITGLKGDITAAPDGAATLSIPLPVSTGRGYSPFLSLNYHSRGGNGPFGIGWSINLPAVRIRSDRGAPVYDGNDEFIGPDGEVLVAILNTAGTPEIRKSSVLLNENLSDRYAVHAYRSRTETCFSYMEYWIPESNTGLDFWVLYQPDGQVQLFGRNIQARIISQKQADVPSRTAVWLIESSVSCSGEQIYWQYRAEDDVSCDDSEITVHPGCRSQRYLSAVWYGNKKAGRALPGLAYSPVTDDWLFTLVFDYGERSSGRENIPVWLMPGSGDWLCREDPFSGWEYGFEVRTRRLCHQVLMYHDMKALTENQGAEAQWQLVMNLLIEYNPSPEMTTLANIRQFAYEPDGIQLTLPPLIFSWLAFSPPEPAAWQLREDMGNFNLNQPYNMVDLNGEGITGILYQDSGAWWYRAPIRGSQDIPDAVTWDKASPVSIPGLQRGGVLADFNGDGYLEWRIITPDIAGQYERTPERGWHRFLPLSALPVEYFQPGALLADISGSGISDLMLIGPKSIRLYSGTSDGWSAAQTIMQAIGITLPVPGTDARVLVAFSDLAGSGQQHLTEIKANGVRYWPNSGHGRFDPPVSIPGFSQPAETFNPDQLYLADIDGSGTTDLIYVLSNYLLVYRNQSGNRFSSPLKINLPEGVSYDNTCSLQLADIRGNGVPDIILTVPHPVPCHWVCHLSEAKSGLLKSINNNMGASYTLSYRSSAQFWLDEKEEAMVAGIPVPPCYLPVALHMLHQKETQDEITGNLLVSTIKYRHGVWDRREREFRGFGFVEISDTDTLMSKGTAAEISMPSISRNWYSTGLKALDDRLPEAYWRGDSAAFDCFKPRFTAGFGEVEQVCIPDEDAAFWLNRGMKGLLLRSELYGADNSKQASEPYSVMENRLQVRLIESRGRTPVVWPVIVENRKYFYERVADDPQCSQQVLLSSDEHGQPLEQLSINYPRRQRPPNSPYPETLPDSLFVSSYDEQQQYLRISRQQNSWFALSDTVAGIWFTGLANSTRQDVFVYASAPVRGLTIELMALRDSPLPDPLSSTLAGQQQIWYLDVTGEESSTEPAFPPRPVFTDVAVLDDSVVATLSADINDAMLIQAGYQHQDDQHLWVMRQNFIRYAGEVNFWLPMAYRDTLLTGEMTISRDTYDCVITETTDASGLRSRMEYDWRFLVPVSLTDVNGNIQTVTLDALGRVNSQRIRGTENGEIAGYSGDAFSIPGTVTAMLSLSPPLPVAQCILYVTDSWMRPGRERIPPHTITLFTDYYDGDPRQQVRQQVVFSDGFGRILQTSIRYADGEAWQRTEDGRLLTGSDNTPQVTLTSFRWAVSGKTEFDNKGQPVRTYQPYFLDSWKYVSDASSRPNLYADTHYYDPTGREWQVITPKGWLRRTYYTPWFVISEDENDTLSESGRFI